MALTYLAPLSSHPFSTADKWMILVLFGRKKIPHNDIATALRHTHQISHTDPSTSKVTFNTKPTRIVTASDVSDSIQDATLGGGYWSTVWYGFIDRPRKSDLESVGIKEEEFEINRVMLFYKMGLWRRDHPEDDTVVLEDDYIFPGNPLQN